MSRQRVGRGGVRTSVDTSRLRAAVGGPGIDPRVWITWATVVERGFDPAEGIFIDVQYQPDGTVETCYLGQPYAGSEFGFHFPAEVGDTVLIAISGGDPGFSPCLIARAHNAADKPNPELQSGDQDTDDVILRVKPGQKLIVRTSGGGDVSIKVEGGGNAIVEVESGQVKLGSETVSAPLQGVVTGESIDPFTGTTFAILGQSSQVVAAKKV